MRSNRISVQLKKLFDHLSGQRRSQMLVLLVLQVVCAGAEAVSLGAVFPFLGALANASKLLLDSRLKSTLDLFSISTPIQLITAFAIVFAIAVLVANLLRLITLYVQTTLSARIGSELSTEVFRRTLFQPYSFHITHNSNELISGITLDVNSVASGLIFSCFSLLTNVLIAIAIVISLLAFNVKITLIAAIAVGGIYLVIMKRTQKSLLENGRKTSEQSAVLIKALQEGLGGIRDVLVDGTQRIFEGAYASADRPFRAAIASNQFIAAAPRYLVEALATVSIVGLAVVMALRTENLDSILPLLGVLALGANRMLPAVQQCFSAIVSIRGYEASLGKVLVALNRPIDPSWSDTSTDILPLSRDLIFDRVSFSYSGKAEDWTLFQINLVIAANTTIALVGSTGSGKSTTADLILGLLTPQEGCVYVDGQPLAGSRLRAWQRSIAHVPQAIYLSDASIAENIAFGIPPELIDMRRVKEVAKLAHLDSFIESRPDRYQEIVGERGVRLSGGQRQRIGIARALYKRPSVIVFDEATSALDTLTEREVMAAIDDLSHKVTIILISHRITTVRRADMIYEFSGGRIVSSGRYEQLIESSDTFRRMASTD